MNSSALLEAFEAELSIEPFGRLGVATCDTLSKRRLSPMLRSADEQAKPLSNLIVEALDFLKTANRSFMVEHHHWRVRAIPLHSVWGNRDRGSVLSDENMITELPHRIGILRERIAEPLQVINSGTNEWLG